MSDSHREIAKTLAGEFAMAALEFLPAMSEAVQRMDGDMKVSFGARVTCWFEKGVVMGELKMSAPKIPTAEVEKKKFVMQVAPSGQLELLFAGDLEDFQAELAERQKPTIPDDGYMPGDNAGVHEE